MAKQATAQPKDRLRVKIQVRHDFNREEYQARTQDLTKEMKNVELKEEAVKAVAATSRAEIKSMKAHVNDMANQLREGYEMRDVEAVVEMDRKKGVKKFYYAPGNGDLSGKFIRQEPMTEEDFALLPLEEPATEAQPPVDATAPPY